MCINPFIVVLVGLEDSMTFEVTEVLVMASPMWKMPFRCSSNGYVASMDYC